MIRGAALIALLSLVATNARANGALPATIQVLVPPDAPATTIVATNYGVISSTDDGGHWRWICEHGLGQQGKAYQLTAPPRGRLLGLATEGLIASDDLACGWTLLDQQLVIPLDYFPDPTRGERVAVLGISRQQQRVYQIAELGSAAPRILYTAPAGQRLSTVEIARSDGQVLYATLIPDDPTAAASIARSGDGGATWTVLTPAPPARDLGILAIDAADARRLFLREVASDGDRLLISEDAGQTLRTLRAPGRVMSAFRPLASGHLMVAWLDVDRGYLERSSDGTTFVTLAPAFHASALAERAGRLYAGLDHFADGYVLAASEDEGDTWRRVMGLSDVVAGECAAAPECAGICRGLITRKVFTPATCGIPPDAGVDAAVDAGVVDAAPAADAAAPTSGGGCSCRVGRESHPRAFFVLVLVLVLVLGRSDHVPIGRGSELPSTSTSTSTKESDPDPGLTAEPTSSARSRSC
jgi:MYXO-CTERM domain-containing protein